MRKKRRGFLLIEGILQIVVLGLVAVGFAALFSSQFTMLSSSKTAVDARQMAELEAAYIRQIGFDDFNSADATGVDENGFHKNGVHDVEIMTNFAGKTSEGGMGDKWYSKVSIVGVDKVGDGATIEKVNGEDDNSLKIAHIDVYRAKDGEPNAAAEKTSRYSMEVPLSSQDSKSKWGPPDRSKARFLSLQELKNFIAPDNGYLYCWVNAYGKEFSGIYVNGLLAYSHEPANSDDNQGHGSLIPFVKGDRVTGFRFGGSDVFYPPFTNYYIYWMPCKR